nr:lysine-rich arabinogalactan protein 19-like [Aegilops tauschii subsp. strangulata]
MSHAAAPPPPAREAHAWPPRPASPAPATGAAAPPRGSQAPPARVASTPVAAPSLPSLARLAARHGPAPPPAVPRRRGLASGQIRAGPAQIQPPLAFPDLLELRPPSPSPPTILGSRARENLDRG